MLIREITEKEKTAYNKVVSHPVQSWEWGEFRKKTGNEVLRLGVFAGDRLKEAYLLTLHKIPYTNYKLGVFLKGAEPTVEMLTELKRIGKEKNLLFIRMEPNVVMQEKIHNTKSLLQRQGAVPGKPFFTKSTFVINLTKSEEELLAAMHPKTRYNIRLSQKKGVLVEEDNSDSAFGRYLDLTDETTRRQNFFAHTEAYHRLMWQALKVKSSLEANNLTAHLLTAKYKGKILITWILFAFGDTLYYPYGASSDENRETMASYSMMWGAIQFGKKHGLKRFDLWGREEGKGFSRFKEGFGPETLEFLGTWDLVINPAMYKIYRILERLRWFVLKLPLPLPKPKFR